jgi:hypothetical protein
MKKKPSVLCTAKQSTAEGSCRSCNPPSRYLLFLSCPSGSFRLLVIVLPLFIRTEMRLKRGREKGLGCVISCVSFGVMRPNRDVVLWTYVLR